MGKTLQTLAHKEVSNKTIFDKRFVVECVENFHIHYRNLRLSLSTVDFIELTKGCIQAFERWNTRGCPEHPQVHIELCKKQIARQPINEGIRVNLNENLYKHYEGRIFAEGSEFTEDKYIHLKIRDMRIEMPISEFKELADVIAEAKKNLEAIPVSVQ